MRTRLRRSGQYAVCSTLTLMWGEPARRGPVVVVPVDVDGPYRHLRQRDVCEQQRRTPRRVDRRVDADVETILLDLSQRVQVVIPR